VKELPCCIAEIACRIAARRITTLGAAATVDPTSRCLVDGSPHWVAIQTPTKTGKVRRLSAGCARCPIHERIDRSNTPWEWPPSDAACRRFALCVVSARRGRSPNAGLSDVPPAWHIRHCTGLVRGSMRAHACARCVQSKSVGGLLHSINK